MITPPLCYVKCVSTIALCFWIAPHNAFLTPVPELQSQLYHSQSKGASALETISDETSKNNNRACSIPNPSNFTTTITTTIKGGSKTDPLALLPQLYTYQKPRQKRQRQTTLTRPRKPRFYWHSPDNLREELFQFWEELDVPINRKINNRDQQPPIPSEYLLTYFNRNDLRWAIAQMGGRENVSYMLDGAKIIPGRWKEAMEVEEVKYLLPLMEEDGKQGLPQNKTKQGEIRRNRTQQPPQADDKLWEEAERQKILTSFQNGMIRSGNSTTNLKPLSLVSSAASTNQTKSHRKEFWSKEKAIKELYQYLESYREHNQRPAVWMPQLAELSQEGYSKLFRASSRFEKLPCVSVFSSIRNQNEDIHYIAGLVPFREWRFFESQLQLLVEMRHYFDLHHNGSEEFFPEPLDVLKHGHIRLHELIRIHGGKIHLAQKLDMKFAWELPASESNIDNPPNSNLRWGSFNLNFTIQLLHFIRSQYLVLDPPLSPSIISMPSEKDLLRCGLDELALQVVRYGGYENVARRLGLAYFDGKSHEMEGRTYRGARLLWRERHEDGVLSSTSSKGHASGRKRQGLAWDENLVIEELHAYVKVNMTKRSLPSYVMPRFRHLDEDERGDLRRSISKFGGVKHIRDKAGLISIEEWEKQYEPL